MKWEVKGGWDVLAQIRKEFGSKQHEVAAFAKVCKALVEVV
jgi:hypothetical protein